MIWKPIQLTLSESEVAGLKGLHGRLQRRLEAGYPLPSAELDELLALLSRCFNQLSEIGECLSAAAGGTNHTLILVHPDSEILSLPWHAATDARSGQAVGLLPHLYITKMLRAPSAVQAPARRAAPPLKVLVLVSMPADLKSEQLRAFQQQQFMLLDSLDPLGQSGEMEIDFADNCTLETLQEKLQRHQYHLVYLAGQGVMKGEKRTCCWKTAMNSAGAGCMCAILPRRSGAVPNIRCRGWFFPFARIRTMVTRRRCAKPPGS